MLAAAAAPGWVRQVPPQTLMIRVAGWRHFGDVAHLAAGARRALAVQMHRGTGDGEPLLVVQDVVADQVGHGDVAMAHRFAERPTGDRADVLLELRDRSAVERPVTGIVHARRDLVDQHGRRAVAAHHEHLDREHTDVIERCGDLCGDRPGLCGDLVRNRRRSARYLQNVVAMLVLGDVKALNFTEAERAAITETSRSNGTKASRIADLVPRSSRSVRGRRLRG